MADNFSMSAQAIAEQDSPAIQAAGAELGRVCVGVDSTAAAASVANLTSTGWIYNTHSGRYGTNYLLRAGRPSPGWLLNVAFAEVHYLP